VSGGYAALTTSCSSQNSFSQVPEDPTVCPESALSHLFKFAEPLLYQNYFGDYGLPEEVKPNFMPALKMLANGFVLQLKTGKDVKENIEQVHTLFLQYAASGEAAKFFSQVQLDIQSKKDQIISEAGVSSSADFREPTISADDKIAIEANANKNNFFI
jgi:hypothetical protein